MTDRLDPASLARLRTVVRRRSEFAPCPLPDLDEGARLSDVELDLAERIGNLPGSWEEQ